MPERYICLNSHGRSAKGVSFDDSQEALWGIMHHSQVVAADLSEGRIDMIDVPALSDHVPTLQDTATLLLAMVQKGPSLDAYGFPPQGFQLERWRMNDALYYKERYDLKPKLPKGARSAYIQSSIFSPEAAPAIR